MSWRRLNIFRHHRRNQLDNKSSRYGVDLVTQDYPDSIIAEQFRTIRTNLSFSNNRCIMITSDGPGEGKSTISANLATVWAKENKRVCLVDCDMRRPTVERTFNLKNKVGLSTYLSNQTGALVKQTKIKNLDVITSGPIPPNPSELIADNRMSELISELKGRFDIIILDAPPVNSVSDTSILASKVDGVILVIPQNIAFKINVQMAIKQLNKVHAHILGAIMNHVTSYTSNYYYYYIATN